MTKSMKKAYALPAPNFLAFYTPWIFVDGAWIAPLDVTLDISLDVTLEVFSSMPSLASIEGQGRLLVPHVHALGLCLNSFLE